jgi:hypothetical protein
MTPQLKDLASHLVQLLNSIDECLADHVPTSHPLRNNIRNMLRRFEHLVDNDDTNGGERFEFDILEEALAITDGDRQADYGSAIASFKRIAAFWSTYKGVTFTPLDVAQMMVLLKVSRSITSPKRDTFVDQAGYSRLAHVVANAHQPF